MHSVGYISNRLPIARQLVRRIVMDLAKYFDIRDNLYYWSSLRSKYGSSRHRMR